MISLPTNTGISLLTATGPDVYTNIPGVTDFNFGQRTAEKIDTTDFDSANNAEESENGIIRPANGVLTCNWEPGDTTQEALVAAVGGAAQTLRSVEVVGAVTITTTATVLILGVDRPRAIGAKNVLTFTISLTGDITEVQT